MRLRAAQSRDAARICEAQRAAAAGRGRVRARTGAAETTDCSARGRTTGRSSVNSQPSHSFAARWQSFERRSRLLTRRREQNAESDGRRKAIQAEKTALEAELAAEQDCRRSLEARLLRVDGAAESRLRGEVAELREALEAAQKSALDHGATGRVLSNVLRRSGARWRLSLSHRSFPPHEPKPDF